MACHLSPKNCEWLYSYDWQPPDTHSWKLMGHGAQGVVHRQTVIVFPSPHTQLSVGLDWVFSCVPGCPSNVCLNCPYQLASSTEESAYRAASAPQQLCWQSWHVVLTWEPQLNYVWAIHGYKNFHSTCWC